MPAMGIRALLRDAKAVFERIEQDQEPVLITRRGRPFAALVPVDPENAEALILSSAPELVESRRRAENSRAEGRTISLEDALRDLDVDEAAEADEGVESAELGGLVDAIQGPLPGLAKVIGIERAEEVDRLATQRVEKFTSDLLHDVVDAELVPPDEIADLVATVAPLNARMVKLRLNRELARRLREVAAISGGSAADTAAVVASPEGLLGNTLTDAALQDATSFVDSIVARNIEVSTRAGRVSPEILEASTTVSVSLLEQADQV